MTIFAILLPAPQPKLAEAIKEAYPTEHFSINDTQWLISANGTAVDVTAKIGIYDAKQPERPPTGGGIVFAITSYYGRAPTPVWDWIKAKLETRPND
jgi:hypothetical protein